MKQNRIRKCLRAAALAVVALILVLAGTVFALWHNEFATLGSFRKLSDRDTAHHDGAVYELTVSGNYYFDDFFSLRAVRLMTLSSSRSSRRASPKGLIPLQLKTTDISCSAFTADTAEGDRVFGRNYDFLPPIRPSSTPTPARGAMLPTPPWTCTSSAWTRTKTWRAWGISS